MIIKLNWSTQPFFHLGLVNCFFIENIIKFNWQKQAVSQMRLVLLPNVLCSPGGALFFQLSFDADKKQDLF